jgi:hypothetical protein
MGTIVSKDAGQPKASAAVSKGAGHGSQPPRQAQATKARPDQEGQPKPATSGTGGTSPRHTGMALANPDDGRHRQSNC